MYNKCLFEKICNVSCSFAELEKFVSDMSKEEFDLENPFEKYYNVEAIISAIEKYQSNQISTSFLAYWMNAYNWIIMGGFKIDNSDESISLKEFLIWTISDWLDSLSFFNWGEEYYNLEDYKNTYRVLDSFWKDIGQCEAVFAEDGYNDDDVVVLITNNNSKSFARIYGELDYNNEAIDFEKVEPSCLENRAKQLNDSGYKELKYNLEYEKIKNNL